jgi:hypothetical protein
LAPVREGTPDDGKAQEVAGIKVLSQHQDIRTVTGEEVVLFTLAGLPN